MAKSNKKNEENAPNVRFVGKQSRYNAEKGKYELVAREAPRFVIDGREKIELPAGIEKGAHVDETVKQRLLGLFPQDFKEFLPGGEK